MKKLGTYFLTVLLLAGLLSVSALAVSDTCVMTVDGKEYTDFEDGWNAGLSATANNDNTVEVVLYADWLATNGSFGSGNGFRNGAIYVSEDTKDMSLDLNGHIIDRGLYNWEDFDGKPTVNKSRGSGEVLQIDSGSRRITVKNGTIRGANNEDYGGIYIDKAEDVVFENITFESNKSDQGGALYNNEGKVYFNDCTFRLNRAEYGGAVYTDYDRLYFDGCTFEQNKADEDGGAIYSYVAHTSIKNSTLKNNVANNSGGAIMAYSFWSYRDNTMSFENCIFTGNKGGDFTSAVYIDNGILDATDTVFEESYGARYVLALSGKGSTLLSCSFLNNDGCAVYAMSDQTTIDNCKFEGNSGPKSDYPSAIFVGDYAGVTLVDTVVQDNVGMYAVNMYSTGKIIFSGEVIITDNKNADDENADLSIDHDEYIGDKRFATFQLSSDFRSTSRININQMEYISNESVICDQIPAGWTAEMLNQVFQFESKPSLGKNEQSYLSFSDGNLYLTPGNYSSDSSALRNSMVTGSLLGDGSLSLIISLVAVVLSASALTVSLMQKKKNGKDSANLE